ncbi:glycoside hydrolase family 113 [Microvirga soli]|uniref:glycoside hydrolase family 113 n=1 Tax=Microvirga soli TaxID=1854496 RepID=UPI00191DFA25|nr:glycoside hydrolase TIM-barrel-like domain-containing protein [Microvirga soli]
MAKLFEFQAESIPSWYDGNYQQEFSRNVLTEIQKDGASQVVIVPTVYMDRLNSTVVYRDNNDPGGVVQGTERDEENNLINDGHARTESDASIRAAISEAKARGLEVIFKLHVNMQNTDWNALIGPGNNPDGTPPTEAQWMEFGAAWFASYKQAVLHYAELAKEQGVTTFAIGNECESMTHPRFTGFWNDIIDEVRDITDGSVKLTYAATWTEALHVGFWKKLDYVGANPYIAFTESNFNPTLQQLIDGWTKPSNVDSTRDPIKEKFGEAAANTMSAMDALKWVAQQSGKKLIFTETGFRSMDGNNTAPWQWGDPHPVDEVEQLNMHKAFYKIITDRVDEGWLAGYWLWNYDASAAVIDPAPDTGYSTHEKLADALVEQYFKNPISVIGLEKTGTALGDALAGGFNNDTLIGGLGNDSLRGNKGADVFSYSGGDGADTILDFNYEQGDKIRLLNAGVADYADLHVATVAGGYRISFDVGGSITILTSDPIRAEWFTFKTGSSGPSTKPTSGDDEITGTSRANVIDARAGNDIVRGLGGNDRLTAGPGDDTVDGGDGNDVVYGKEGDDYIEGAAGADRLYGGDGADIVYGGVGNDQVRGDTGNDMLYGEAGNDLIRGGEGYDLLNGGGGNDKLYGEAGNDHQLDGGEGNDLVNGGDGNDGVEGGDGDDKLYGGNGDDAVQGWFGNDQMWGGAGNDMLEAGGGADKLWGGKGADDFVFGEGMTKDVIYDFKLKQGDQLIVQGNMNGTGIGSGATDAEVMQKFMKLVKQVGRDTVINFGDGDVLTLKNFKAATLDRGDLWFW